MSGRGLFVGVVVTDIHSPGKIDTHIDTWTMFASNADEAMGNAVTQTIEKYPNGKIAFTRFDDLTSYALEEMDWKSA